MKPQDLTLEQILNRFVDEVVHSLPLGDTTDEQKALIRELVINRVDKRLMALIIQELPEDEFQNILRNVEGKELSDEDEMQVMASAIDYIPDFGEKLIGALEMLRGELTEDFVELKNSSNP